MGIPPPSKHSTTFPSHFALLHLKILDYVDELEQKGEIDDLTGIDGPFESLQLMLKRRNENLALQANSTQQLTQSRAESKQLEKGCNGNGDDDE
ncbi:hypothetical protein [Nitrosomonas sp. Is37]|uniref:hypothetical protein n=1 Tax=Nitrosomonas sp. Is37 TaxID=3080535 RepID=UPI00294AEF8C|nr:hypothetical protein [Nitrosomonas sp. Is37]MDV6344063.1 hypothetical protein [Nitrosomonas sp. Is37]